jgi:hypothetical protein
MIKSGVNVNPPGPDPKEIIESWKPRSKPGGVENDPEDPTSPNEPMEEVTERRIGAS